MGSAIALSIAQRAAVDVRGLFLLGAAARMPVSGTILTGSVNALSDVASWIADNALIEATPTQREGIHRQVLGTGEMTTYGDFLACNRFDLRSEVASITIPALVVAGTLDRMTPLRFSESLAASLSNGQLATLEGCGHFTMLERTETRFLIITHHALTMARMHRLFGVTMLERGVSQLVSVNLQEAETLAEAV